MRDYNLLKGFTCEVGSSLIILLFGLFILLSGKKSLVKWVTFFLALTTSISHMLEVYLDIHSFIFNTVTPLSVYGYPLFGAFIPAILVHFHLIFPITSFKAKRRHLFLLYLPALFFAWISLSLGYIDDIYSKDFEVTISYTSYYLLYGIYAVISFSISIFILISRYKKETNVGVRKQIKLLLISEIFLAAASIAGYNVRYFLDFNNIYLYDIGLVLFFGVLSYSIAKYQAFDIKTALHYSVLWLFSVSLMLTPVVIAPLFLNELFRFSSTNILIILYSIISISYFSAMSKLVFPLIKRIFLRRNKLLLDSVNSVRNTLETANTFEDLSNILKNQISTLLFSNEAHLILSNSVVKIFPEHSNRIGDYVVSNSDLNCIGSKENLLNRKLIEDKIESSLIQSQIHFIMKIDYEEELLGYLFLEEKKNLKPYFYEDVKFLEAIQTSIGISIQRFIVRQKVLEVEVLSRLKTNLFINLAHETRTPATLINNYLDKCLEKYPTDRDLQVVKINVEKLVRDMINFLDSEKIEQGRLCYNEKHQFDVSEYLNNKADLITPTANQKGIKVGRAIVDKVKIVFNIDAMERIINNLLDNALRYTKNNGKIAIELIDNVSTLTIKISDNGIGISKEKADHIFDKFYQISHKKGNSQGIGMGLYIVKNIIDSVGGKISFYDNKPGTCFILELPKLSCDIETITINENYKISTPLIHFNDDIKVQEITIEDEKYTILVVEDNYDLLKSMRDELSKEFNTLTATNGIVALELLKNYLPDVIVSDIMMDEMDGYELLKQVKHDKKYSEIPFIFLTAKTGITEEIKGLTSGAIDYVPKPFDMEYLKTRIKSIIDYNLIKTQAFELEKYRCVGKLTASICHDILNPLTGIKGPLKIIEKCLDTEKSEKMIKGFGYINENLAKIDDIVSTMRTLFYGDIYTAEIFNVKQVLEPLLNVFQNRINGEIKIRLAINEDFIINSNKKALTQALINIIANAVESITKQGEIIIETKSNDKNVIIITDNGIGIEEKNLKRLYDIAFTTKEKKGGTGLGLFIVKELLTKLDIKIDIKSKDGKGTTVSLLFDKNHF